MTRPCPAHALGLLLALAAVSAALPVAAASPASLTRATFDYDPAVFEVLEDAPTSLGASVVLKPRDGLALFMFNEYLGVADMSPSVLLSDSIEGERPAKPPFPVDKGPDGWECAFKDLEADDASASVMECGRNVRGDLVFMRVMTTPGLTSPELYEAIRTMVATIRFVDTP